MEDSLRKLQLDHDAAQHAALVAEGALTDAEARLVAAEDACRAGLAREAELEQALQAASQRSSTNAELSRAVLCSVAACALQRIVKQGSQLVAEAKAASAWPQTPTSQVHKALKARLTAEARSCDAVMPVAAQAQGRALMVAAGGTVKKMPPVTLGEGAQEGSSWTALAAACVSVATGSLPDGGQPLLDFLAGTHLRDEWSGEMAPRTAAKALALVSACMDDECE